MPGKGLLRSGLSSEAFDGIEREEHRSGVKGREVVV
jgi:hypothetical protein